MEENYFKTMKKNIFIAIALLISTFCIASTPKFCPQKLAAYGPISVQKPLLLDSIDLKGKKYTSETLLATPVSFPSQNKYTLQLQPDTAGYFYLTKPAVGSAFYLISFYVNSSNYAKAKLKIKSPDRFELYINEKKETDKKTLEDSLKTAKSAETDLKGIINGVHVILKYLVSADSKTQPAFQISIEPSKEDSTNIFTFDEKGLRRITIEDILVGKRVTSSSVSPSGRLVLLTYSLTDESGKTQYQIEVFDSKQNKTIFSENSSRNQLGWMPNSDLLRYFSDSDKGWSLYNFNPLTGETTILANNLPKESFTFSPDEKSLFYSKKETLEAKSPEGLNRLLSPEDRQDYYRNRFYIYQYQFSTGLSQQLTFGQHTASINDISLDGHYMLFSTSKETLTEQPFSKNTMFLLDLQTMKLDTLWKDEKFANSAEFSPDGKQILISGAPEAFNGIGLNIKPGQIANSYDTQAFIMNLESRNIDPITKYFNPAINSQWWNIKDNCIYFKVDDKDCENIYKYTPATRKYEKLPLKEELIRSFSLSKESLSAAYVGSSVSNSNRAYVLNLKNMQSTLLADPYGERLSKLELGEVKNWDFKAADGTTIEGRYYLPPHFNPAKKYPLIVYYYGGTSPTQRTFESTYPLNVYAGMDYVVYTLEPSGTTGFGQEFSARHVNAWGKMTADEIMEGTKKFTASHSFIDSTKIGCIGASYGGFMTQYLITRTNMFTAAVSHAGISSISSYWGEGFWGYTYSSGASTGSYPWNNKEMYIEQSPLFNADKINTPLLLTYGTADTNVPPGESIQMYTALKILGKPVELVQVEGENHIILDFKKRINFNHTIYAWFAKWLKNDSDWWENLYPEK